MKIIKINYTLLCDCGTILKVNRTENNTIFFKCPKCNKTGGINPKEKIAEDE